MNETIEPVVRARRGERAQARRRRNVLVASCVAVIAVLGVVVVVLERHDGAELAAVATDPTVPAVADGWIDPPDDAAPAGSVASPQAAAAAAATAALLAEEQRAEQQRIDEQLPPSGDGRRVVFSIERQRMWWVDHDGTVLRTALVSGRENTPRTGTFQVYSKSLNATGLDGSRMDYFVRFTHGPNGWAIGFHDIPRVDGEPVQSDEELGLALSAGCIRQSTEDAVFTWEFLDVGDTVVVVA